MRSNDRATGAGKVTEAARTAAPMLLTMASYMGTLAATRCLGRLGIPVHVAEASPLAPAKWSRYVSRRFAAPLVSDEEAFLQFLLQFGKENPGYVLYPTSDEMAWLISSHLEMLSSCFHLYSPGPDCLNKILNKRVLTDICSEIGISTPETFFPESDEDLEKLSREVSYPVLIKPRTQVFFRSHHKGEIANNANDLLEKYPRYRENNEFGPRSLKDDPFLKWPMVQLYYPEANENIYSLSGFIDESGEGFTVRAMRKVLQEPRRVGIGLCFEDAPVEPALREKVQALCRRLGYFGVFEIEFIPRNRDGAFLLTDFNPRFFNQMAFDIAREMPLPAFVYYAALGETETLGRALQAAAGWRAPGAMAYCYRFMFSLMLKSLRAAGRLAPEDYQQWRKWFAVHSARMVDPVQDRMDRVPALVDTAHVIYRILRHPRGFLKGILESG